MARSDPSFFARLALLFCGLTCAVLMLGPFQGLEKMFVPWDKAAHFLIFYGLTVLLLAAFPRRRRLDLAVLATFAGCAMEIGQRLSGRDAEFGDMAANVLGVLAVVGPMQVERLRARAGRIERRRRLWRRAEAARPQPDLGPAQVDLAA